MTGRHTRRGRLHRTIQPNKDFRDSMNRVNRRVFLALSISLLTAGLPACTAPIPAPPTRTPAVLTLATTTSTQDSGLLDFLLPVFEKQFNTQVKVVAVGTGQALDLARRGDADVVFVHAKSAEEKFVSEGHGVKRLPVMYNDFVLIGPKADPARIGGGKDIFDALRKIKNAGAPFVSRGDRSGTHIAEIELWKLAGIDIAKDKGPWYRETGQGMGPALTETAVWTPPELEPPSSDDRINTSLTYGFVFDMCGIEIDPITYQVRVDRYVSMHDAGRMLNPLIADGQMRGAFAQGIAAALYEEFVYNDEGAFQPTFAIVPGTSALATRYPDGAANSPRKVANQPAPACPTQAGCVPGALVLPSGFILPQGTTSITVPLEPPGVTRRERLRQLDFRLSKTFRVNRLTIAPTLEAYNVLNSDKVFSYQSANYANASGTYLVPSTILLGRVVGLGAQVRW